MSNPATVPNPGIYVPYGVDLQLDQFYKGFFYGIMKYNSPAAAEASGHACLGASNTIRGQEELLYVMLRETLQQKRYNEWALNIEYFAILNFITEFWKTLIIVDHECKLDAYFYRVVGFDWTNRDWVAWYSALSHHIPDMIMYFYYFIAGFVWYTPFDITYAIGTWVKYFVDLTIEELP